MSLIEGLLARIGGTAIIKGVSALVGRFRPIRISARSAPRNFFEFFGPGVTKEFVKSVIGPAHRQSGHVWLYQFSDALAQFDFKDGDSARSVALALTNESPVSGFDLPMLESSLGRLTLDDFNKDQEGVFMFRSGMRYWELLCCVKFPPHWVSNYYTFGALSLIAPGKIRDVEFDVRMAKHSPRVASKGVLVNWVGISESPEEMWFDWSIAMPASR